MKLIIGLGNPGETYRKTRHNTGFLFVEALKDAWIFPEFSQEKKFASSISSGIRKEERLFIAKPETFMNRSGDAVFAIMNFYKLSPEDILVVHDDLDIPFGSWKEATDSGSAGHNGVADIIGRIGTKQFKRIRIGIGRPSDNRDPSDYVLEPFSPEELIALPEIFKRIAEGL